MNLAFWKNWWKKKPEIRKEPEDPIKRYSQKSLTQVLNSNLALKISEKIIEPYVELSWISKLGDSKPPEVSERIFPRIGIEEHYHSVPDTDEYFNGSCINWISDTIDASAIRALKSISNETTNLSPELYRMPVIHLLKNQARRYENYHAILSKENLQWLRYNADVFLPTSSSVEWIENSNAENYIFFFGDGALCYTTKPLEPLGGEIISSYKDWLSIEKKDGLYYIRANIGFKVLHPEHVYSIRIEE